MSTTTITTAEQLWQHHPAGRCELVRGELRMMSPAGGRHGRVVVKMAVRLAVFVEARNLGCVFGADTGFIIQRDPDSVRAPDLAFIGTNRLPDPLPVAFFEGPPDLAIEVLSPSDSASEVQEKTEDWLTAGCQEVWLVDPRRKAAFECSWSAGAVVRRSVTCLTSRLLPGFERVVDELFQR